MAITVLVVIGFMVRAFVRGYKQGKNNNGNRE